MRQKEGLKSIQIDIPEAAHKFIVQQLEELKALTGETVKLSDVTREALANYFHVSSEFFSVSSSEEPRSKRKAKAKPSGQG